MNKKDIQPSPQLFFDRQERRREEVKRKESTPRAHRPQSKRYIPPPRSEPPPHTGSPPPTATGSPPPTTGSRTPHTTSRPSRVVGCRALRKSSVRTQCKPFDIDDPIRPMQPLAFDGQCASFCLFFKLLLFVFLLPCKLVMLIPCGIIPMTYRAYRYLRAIFYTLYVASLPVIILALFYIFLANKMDETAVGEMTNRSLIKDRKGQVIGTLHGENRRMLGSLDEVPAVFLDALIVQEDRRFWGHRGVDPRGIVRAFAQFAKHKRFTQGGSTLTMQLAKNTYLHKDRTYHHKLLEMMLALRLEARYDKPTILLAYVNRIFWGHTFLGVRQAARGYFDKEPKDLTVGECALLAGIINNPNGNSPHKNLAGAKAQRDLVLGLMKRVGAITASEYTKALAEPINTRWPAQAKEDDYVMTTLRREVDHILTQLEKDGVVIKEKVIREGGLVINCTLDLSLQRSVLMAGDRFITDDIESAKGYPHQTRAQYKIALEKHLKTADGNTDPLIPKYLQVAGVVIHNKTGAVLALFGGRDSEESSYNRALQSRRQVGSIFKPFLYAAYFEKGGKATDKISDNAIKPGEIAGVPKKQIWTPRNADGRFSGMREVGWGLLKSRNTMSVRVGNHVGLKKIIHYVSLAGYDKASQRWLGPTIYLGTWEASPLEVASSYTTFANGGVRSTPYIIESIIDRSGRLLWEKKPERIRVFSAKTNALIVPILQEITKTGTAASIQRLGYTAPCAGKTGTTNKYKNAWFCGFGSDITAAVWVGLDRQRKIMDKGYGAKLALPIWVEIMKEAQAQGYPANELEPRGAKDSKPTIVRLCRESGALAHDGCVYADSCYDEDVKQPSKDVGFCTLHKRRSMTVDETMPDAQKPVQSSASDAEKSAEKGAEYTPAID